jgi:hypothetical protein
LDLPGDFWESGTLLRYLREREVQVCHIALACGIGMCLCCVAVLCCLPGDLWESGTLLRYLREREVQVRHISAYKTWLNAFSCFVE